MHFLQLALLSSTAVSTALAAPERYPIQGPSSATPKAVYVMSNKADNCIHAFPVNKWGKLSGPGKVTGTGGKGERAASAMLGDALNSQSPLAIADNYLFAVNAGSNTLSMLKISPHDPLSLTLLGAPVSSKGDFPNTVAISPKHKLACVANTGTRSNLACYRYSRRGLHPIETRARPLTLDPPQTNPPFGPGNTVSQAFFSADESALLVTVKGALTPNATNRGYIASYPVSYGGVAMHGSKSSPQGTQLLFGSVPLRSGRVFTTDPSFGAATLEPAGKRGMGFSVLKKTPIPQQGASCWAARSRDTGLAYVTDDAANTIVAFEPESGRMVKRTVLGNGNKNMIEAVAARGSWVYALTHGTNGTMGGHGPAVVVVKAGKGGEVKEVQNFLLGASGLDVDVDGMAVLE